MWLIGGQFDSYWDVTVVRLNCHSCDLFKRENMKKWDKKKNNKMVYSPDLEVSNRLEEFFLETKSLVTDHVVMRLWKCEVFIKKFG